MKTKHLCLLLPLVAVALNAADFHDHLGIQMWSLRETAKESPTKALDLVKEYGLKEIETAGFGNLTVEQYAAEVKARGLVAVGTHAGYEALRKDLPGLIKTAKTLGAGYIICPWIGKGKEGFTEEMAHQVAADFNAWGKTVREAGLKLGIHPHGFEFVPTKAGNGETMFDIIARETDPENVVFEMDVFWVFHAGQDPVKLLQKYGKRWELMHVKDIRKGAVTGLTTGSAPPTDNVAVGSGQIDWPSVLRTAQEVGVKHYLIEDETPAPLQCIPASLAYLRDLKL
ncbi:MAG TPA: sugar phosphate isomerase/epimerase [Opitutus sp.]|nr:sugar phosphate isomerase/epimerase [Opitutus sp.]